MSLGGPMRYLAASKKPSQGVLQLRVRVKPGVSKGREGVKAVDDDAIELCVAAQAKDGEANDAVLRVLSKILHTPKSNLTLSRGMRSREKTITVQDVKRDDGPAYAATILALLRQASLES